MEYYKVWQVFSKEGARFYVVNQVVDSNKIQSTWNNYLEAKAVCDKLNKLANKVVERNIV